MSRKSHDFYETPAWCTRLLLREHFGAAPIGRRILEPCAGNGAIIKVLRECNPSAWIEAMEIRPEAREKLKQVADNVRTGDFLKTEPGYEKYDLIITNPPYSIAQKVAEHAFKIAGLGKSMTEVIMLLRLGFLQAQERHDFWQRWPVQSLYIMSKRPSFTGGGTDNSAYAWFVWRADLHQKIRVIG